MGKKQIERKKAIADYIQEYYLENDQFPSEHDIVTGTGIPAGSVHRMLVEMRDDRQVFYDGRRSIRTEMLERVSPKKIMPVLGTVACGPGEEEDEEFMEYIHMSERMVGKCEFFALVAKGESMVDAGVHPGDYVIVRRQQTADDGDIIVALLEGRNNLKILVKNGDDDDGVDDADGAVDSLCILRSCNKSRPEDYPDIIPDAGGKLNIQGVAVGAFHRLRNMGHKPLAMQER